jgi:cardiolipin synthase
MMQATDRPVSQQARPWLRAPDWLTAIRVPLAFAFVLTDRADLRLGILATAAATDLLDGFWARRLGGSRLGVVLDPVCDKLFMAAAFYVVYRSGALSWLEIGGVLLRDVLAAVGFAATLLLGHPTTLPARAGGKAVTTGQLLTLVAFVAGSELLRPLAWATAAMAVYALADYGRLAWHR